MLLEEPDRRIYLKRFRRPNLENIQRQALCKAVNTLARKVVFCPYCSSTNGAVKKAGVLKIIHDKFRAKKTAEELERWKKTFSSAVESQKELGLYLNRSAPEELNPLKVLDLFKRISDEVSQHHHGLAINSSPSGLRTTWSSPRLRTTGGVYLAIYLSTTCMHSPIRGSRWCIQRGRSHCETH